MSAAEVDDYLAQLDEPQRSALEGRSRDPFDAVVPERFVRTLIAARRAEAGV